MLGWFCPPRLGGRGVRACPSRRGGSRFSLRVIPRPRPAGGIDRATYLRRLISAGLRLEDELATLADYAAGRRSAGRACAHLNISPWELPDLLRSHHLHRNVDMEDWLDSSSLEGR